MDEYRQWHYSRSNYNSRVCRSVIISVSININHFTPNIFNFDERKCLHKEAPPRWSHSNWSIISTTNEIQTSINNFVWHLLKHSFDILLWNSFWHLHRRLYGMRVLFTFFFLRVCTFFLHVHSPFFSPSSEWWIWPGFPK